MAVQDRRRSRRPADALSRDVITRAAIEILDAGGAGALTFRALNDRLSTGFGAIYHHVASKSDLLAAATDEVLAGVIAEVPAEGDPGEVLRGIAVGLFDAIEAHPWIGGQLSGEPWRAGVLDLYERIGEQLEALHVPDRTLFDAASLLLHYIFGVASQDAVNARALISNEVDRSDFLASVATRWAQLDPTRYRFVRRMERSLREHDDREQFLAGVDLILAGTGTAIVPRSTP